MSSGGEEKLYRVKTKDGAHINEKRKEDGSKSAIQFDDKNGLQGPVDIIEVDESEYTREIYIEVERKERSITEIIFEDIITPVAVEVLNDLTERAVAKGLDVLSTKVIPAAKVKCSKFKVKILHDKKRKRKRPATQRPDAFVTKDSTVVQSVSQKGDEQQVYHSQEEANQIVNNMKFAALYIAAGIRELSRTIIIATDNPEKTTEIEAKFRELTSDQIMNTINFMLEEENRQQLDQVTLQLFEAFRKRELIVDGEAIPISKVFNNE